MEMLTSVQDLRDRFGISQEVLAKLLLTRRSHLSYVEAGTRYLSAASIHRLALLESSYQKTVAGNMIVPMPVDVKNAQKIIKQYHYRLLFNERAIYEYQKKLVQLRQMFTQNQHWYQVLEMIKLELTDDEKDVEQFRWLTDQQQVALRNFQHCNSIVQAELQLKIHLLTAEEGVLRQFLSANGHVP